MAKNTIEQLEQTLRNQELTFINHCKREHNGVSMGQGCESGACSGYVAVIKATREEIESARQSLDNLK
jgi:hypothetical protein